MSAGRPLRLRIRLVEPPAGVAFSLQDARNQPVDPVISDGREVVLEPQVTAAGEGPALNFTGPFVRRSGAEKHVYFCVGTLAGQHDSPWTRRGKVMLADLPPELVARALDEGRVLEARFAGKARDGGPACARMRALDGWRLA